MVSPWRTRDSMVRHRLPREAVIDSTAPTTQSTDQGGGGIDKALLGGLLFLALFLVAVVVGIVIFFMCYCRRAKRSSNKYRENAAGLHRLKNESNHMSGPAAPMNPNLQRAPRNVFANFVTSKEHSEQGNSTTGMLNVQDLQRLQIRNEPGEKRYSYENVAYVPTDIEAGHSAQQKHAPSHGNASRQHLHVEDKAIESYSERSIDAHEKHGDSRKRYLVDSPQNVPEQHARPDPRAEKYHESEDEYAYDDSRHAAEEKLHHKPPPVAPRDNLPSCDRHSESSECATFTHESDRDSEFDEFTISRTSAGDKPGGMGGTWAEAGGPQFHVKKPRPGMEDSLVLESNIMYESVDASNHPAGGSDEPSSKPGADVSVNTIRTRRSSLTSNADFSSSGRYTGLPEVEALNELDSVISSHTDLSRADSPPLNPVYMLPPLEAKKLPPIKPGKSKHTGELRHRDKNKLEDERRPRLREKRHSTSEHVPEDRESHRHSRSRNQHGGEGSRHRSSSMSRIQANRQEDQVPSRHGNSRTRGIERSYSEENLIDKRHLDNSRDRNNLEHSERDQSHSKVSRTRPGSARSRTDSRKSRPDSGRSRHSSGHAVSESERSPSETGRSRPEPGKPRPDSAKRSNRHNSPDHDMPETHGGGKSRERHGHHHTSKPDASRPSDDRKPIREKHEREYSEKVRTPSDNHRYRRQNSNDSLGDTTDSKPGSHVDDHKDTRHKSDKNHRQHVVHDANGYGKDKEHRHHRSTKEDHDDKRHHRKHETDRHGERRHQGDRHRHGDRPHGDSHHHRYSHKKGRDQDDGQDDLAMTLHADDELYQFHKKAMTTGEVPQDLVSGKNDMSNTLNSTGQSSTEARAHRKPRDGGHRDRHRNHNSSEKSSSRVKNRSPGGSPHRTRSHPANNVYLGDLDNENYEV